MKKSILILFCYILMFSSFACVHISNDLEDDNLIVLHEKTFPIAQDKLFKITTTSGAIEITSWDKDEVYIKVSGNKKAQEKVDFTFNNDNEEIEVTAKKKGSFFNFSFSNVKMKFQIKLPRKFNNDLKTAGGDIFIENLQGKQLIKTSGGDVKGRNLDGYFNAGTSGGDFKLENLSGKIKISTSGGDINLKNFKGEVDASTSGGNIRLAGTDGKILAHTSGGNIQLDYSGENKGIEVSTSGGNIGLLLPADFNASANLSTSGGDIDTDFRGNNAVRISSTRFEADLNNGGNPLVVKTSGGEIDIKKK